jgi:hypothetical protein
MCFADSVNLRLKTIIIAWKNLVSQQETLRRGMVIPI